MMQDFKPILKPHYQEVQEKENRVWAAVAGIAGGAILVLAAWGFMDLLQIIVRFAA
jgi:hypothetical protein